MTGTGTGMVKITWGLPMQITNSHWVDQYKHAVRCSFEEEVELYELLDLDAEDEEEADVDVDDTTGEILIG